MHVISKRKLREFRSVHHDAETPFDRWFDIAEEADWQSFEDIRAEFGRRADRYGKFLIFDIGGNKYRLIVAAHFNRGILYVRHVLTHAEYDDGDWKEE